MAERSPKDEHRPRVVDVHCHLEDNGAFRQELDRTLDAHGIDAVWLFTAGRAGPCHGIARSNESVLAVHREHPRRVVPFAAFNLGIDRAADVDRLADQGFRGIKFINPTAPYNAREYFEVYAAVARRPGRRRRLSSGNPQPPTPRPRRTSTAGDRLDPA